MGILNNTKKILGKKIGMTQVFSPEGKLMAVTAIEAAVRTLAIIRETPAEICFCR